MLERGDDVLYICVDNGAYMNTGGQRSGATPLYAATTTDPPGRRSLGKRERKKDLPAIVAAHGVPYVATASVAYLGDLRRKVRRAMAFRGSRYIQIDTPCPSVWGFPSHLTLEVGRLGVKCGLIPLYEMENGQIVSVKRIKRKVPVTEYLRLQRRFHHLLDRDELKRLQEFADDTIRRYGLLGPSEKGGSHDREGGPER
jgi:pyruvate ferredoxin oxidoreductase beta subunit